MWHFHIAFNPCFGQSHWAVYDLKRNFFSCRQFWKQDQNTKPGDTFFIICEKCVGSLTSPGNQYWEEARDGPEVYCPYPKRLEFLTICRCRSKDSTSSLVMLRLWMLVPSGAWTLDLPHSTTWANQVAVHLWLSPPTPPPFSMLPIFLWRFTIGQFYCVKKGTERVKSLAQ